MGSIRMLWDGTHSISANRHPQKPTLLKSVLTHRLTTAPPEVGSFERHLALLPETYDEHRQKYRKVPCELKEKSNNNKKSEQDNSQVRFASRNQHSPRDKADFF